MGHPFSIPIEQIVDFLGLERNPRSVEGASSFNVKCPLCPGGDKGYHMNINTEKDAYFCFACMKRGESSGALDLYARVRQGETVNSSNAKELYKKLLRDMNVGETGKKPEKHLYSEPAASRIPPAKDSSLNECYAALINLPCLKLNKRHRENLHGRGFSDADIQRNGYASVPDSRIYNCPELKKWKEVYEKENLEAYRKGTLSYYKQKDIQLGLMIAEGITEQGISCANVPGFYKFGEYWCLKCDAGMLIPTRNPKGEIVGMQTRRDVKTKKGLRYMTLSSKGLPEGVTERIARTHYPLGNAGLSAKPQILLTEGPLKADAALAILKNLGADNVMFAAVQGVSNTGELPKLARALKKKGVTQIINAFDMDKLVNVHVMEAAGDAAEIFASEGIGTSMLLWGSGYVREKAEQMYAILGRNDISMQKSDSPAADIARMSRILKKRQIDYDFLERDGEIIRENWSPSEKGIDDYLLKLAGRTESPL